ncbi:HNH endonuclease family protein [Pseudidiomarina sp.]|uniref:HNH endonuclease family protein n=1 Tax=Pseudidiomarina sp. TaxID=2081707 RepID=UPI003A9818F2
MLKRFALLAVTAAFATTSHAATVKQSSSGICHDQSSSYYERTKRFKPFSSLDACLRAGGRLPKGYSSSSASSSNPPTSSSGYSREQFGRGWADMDGDCQNSRHEALIAQSTGQVRFKTGRECRVVAGRWISPFTGAVIHDPSMIDIDHVVPLKWAWDRGANRWSPTQRERFANDPANLLSVEASLNRQKGAKGPDQWLPPANQCQYVLRFTRVMKTYKLKLSPAEERRLTQTRSRVCG